MYLLILVSFLHMATVKPEPIATFKTQDECLAKAGLLNRANVNDTQRAAGVQFVCFAVVYPT